MAAEIERSWLVTSDAWREQVTSSASIEQAYLAVADDRSVRIRLTGDRAILTIKTGGRAMVREEVEIPVDPADGRTVVDSDVVVGSVVAKTRHLVPLHDGLVAEVDEFAGDNADLIVVEVELPSADTVVHTPDWFGDEVTDDARYRNARLALEPYTTW